MTDAEQIADCEASRVNAERATLDAQIRLAIARERIAALESAENRRLKTTVQTASKN